MKRPRRRQAALALIVGCSSPPARPPDPPKVVIQADTDGDLMRRLAAEAVSSSKFARRTLYTWTTSEQVTALGVDRRLLVRDESPTNGASYIDQVLHKLAAKDKLAALLYTAPFAKMRFAWPTMWPTRAGWPNEHYGDELIRITLKPEAWIVHLTTATGTFVVHDMQDAVVPIETVLADPKRIAAIYFVSDNSVTPAPGFPRPHSGFREYALCNESMIEWYEVGTARVAKELDQAIALVESLTKLAGKTTDTAVARAWDGSPTEVVGAYHATLALDSPNYELRRDALEELIALLRASRPQASRGAIKGAPTAVFAPGPPRKPPRIVRRGGDTFARAASATSARP
jgi:hypothetical protein